jgi:hypothetical protein
MGYVEGVDHFYQFGKYYVPETTLESSPVAKCKGWAVCGVLTALSGYSNDYQAVEDEILGLYRKPLGYDGFGNLGGFDFKMAAWDSYQSDHMSGNFSKAGITDGTFDKKNAKTYSPAMDWLTSLVLSGRWHFSVMTKLCSGASRMSFAVGIVN